MKAYVFPGQGSQFTGMGKDLYDSTPLAREMMETANEILGFRITDTMFNGSVEELKETRITQPAIFIHSVVAAACGNFEAPDMVAGHSLGEYSALCAANALDFEDALRLVARRAELMQDCCERHPGGMAAIIGLGEQVVEEICAKASLTSANAAEAKENQNPIVVAANYNCDGQIVISGDNEAITRACELMKEAGAKRALPLPVSGAFHSPLMEDARAELALAIENTVIKAPSCPIYQNVSAKGETSPDTIRKNLLEQLTSPVRWTQSVKAMMADGATSFTEIGPGNVLQNLIRRINN